MKVRECYDIFARNYDWSNRGDEWSEPWGGTRYLWSITIFPRIQSFLPSPHILEIAPGFGRCTQFLKDLCERLTVVDISEKCIHACQERFRDSGNISYFINDGKSLNIIPDRSIDFVFSWDSLVHADNTVMNAYIKQLPRIMKPGAFGFIHHSNLAEYVDRSTGTLMRKDLHSRDETMDSSLFLQYCNESGLHCLVQEKIAWRCNYLNDCFSVITYGHDNPRPQCSQIENYRFMEEAAFARFVSKTYDFRNQMNIEDQNTPGSCITK